MSTLAPNRNISPLIRGARYIAFFSGIAYGYNRLQYLRSKEKIIQEREDIIKAKRAVQAKIMHEQHMKEHMLAVAKEMGHTPVHKEDM